MSKHCQYPGCTRLTHSYVQDRSRKDKYCQHCARDVLRQVALMFPNYFQIVPDLSHHATEDRWMRSSSELPAYA